MPIGNIHPHQERPSELEYRMLMLSVRPARLAILVPVVEHWGFHCFKRALEALSRKWGGAGDIIIPFESDRQISEPFWRLLKLFDPDALAIYSPTYADQQIASSDAFTRNLSRFKEKHVANGTWTAEEAERHFLSPDHLRQPIFNFAAMQASLERRLLHQSSPTTYEVDGKPHLSINHLIDDTSAPQDTVDMLALSRVENEAITLLIPEGVDELHEMMVLDRTGYLGPATAKLFEQHGWSIHTYKITPLDRDLFALLHSRGHVPADSDYGAGDDPGPPTYHHQPMWAGVKHHKRFPLARTALRCGWRAPDTFYHMWPSLIVIGDTPQDYCLASCIRRFTQKSYWLPLRVAEGQNDIDAGIRDDLWKEIGRQEQLAGRNAKVYVTSVSLPLDRIRELVAATNARASKPFHLDCDVSPPNQIPIDGPLRLFHHELVNSRRLEPFRGNVMCGEVDTPIPEDCTSAAPGAMSWFVDVVVERWQPPTRACLNEKLHSSPSLIHNVRCSARGISYYSHKLITRVGVAVADSVQKPKLQCRSAIEIFQDLLARRGMTAEISDKGSYLSGSIELFGSLGALAEVFRQQSTNAIFEAYRGKRITQDEKARYGDLALPVFVTGRRFLTLSGIMVAGGIECQAARLLVDDWIARGIMARGLILKCDQCSYAAWYAVGEFGADFRCQRCRRRCDLKQNAWLKPPDEPVWYYDLAEIVFQAVNQRTRMTILTLARLSENAASFLFAPELNVWTRCGQKCELDVWAIKNGRIILGEVTTKDHLEARAKKETRRLHRIRSVCHAVSADEILFVTESASWKLATNSRIETCFKRCQLRPAFWNNGGAD